MDIEIYYLKVQGRKTEQNGNQSSCIVQTTEGTYEGVYLGTSSNGNGLQMRIKPIGKTKEILDHVASVDYETTMHDITEYCIPVYLIKNITFSDEHN